MSRSQRGVRDGSGPYRGSQRSGGQGRRQAAGQTCPNRGGKKAK